MIFLKIISKENSETNEGSFTGDYPASDHANLRINFLQRKWHPLTDVYETDEEFVIRMEVAGMLESEFSIEVDRQAISISGTRQDISSPRAFYQLEIPFGEFSIAIEFPSAINPNHVSAEYTDGFLYVHAPKIQPTQIHIQRKE